MKKDGVYCRRAWQGPGLYQSDSEGAMPARQVPYRHSA
jgi:hypothetical protein